jgi:cyclopropane-fatty-acyl-phospholipid synthase
VTSVYGDGTGAAAHLIFVEKSAERDFLVDPETRIGEAYMDGRIDFADGTLREFLHVVNTNVGAYGPTFWMQFLDRIRYRLQVLSRNNALGKARKNISHHYDLDERLYRLFLDSDLQYSCAYFPNPSASLEEAQRAKKRHIAAKLALKPGQTVLDIGSGWGGLGIYLAQVCGVDVTGVTLSEEQHRVSNERAKALGLADRVRFELCDYRLLEKPFDRIVSVGMFEHVGAARFGEYFRHAKRLLKPGGTMLLHSIGRFGPPQRTNPWLTKYIFPGGYIPSISEVIPSIEKAGLFVTDMEILRLHYGMTLKHWRERFLARRDEATALYDDRFVRMWDFYLAASESAFRTGSMMNFQIQLSSELESLPLTRDYMGAVEQELARRESSPESLRMAGA